MSTDSLTSADAVQSLDELAALSPAERRALTEELHAYHDHDLLAGADGLWAVYPESGAAKRVPQPYYTVDARSEACNCPWKEYNQGRCKHREYIAYLTGEKQIPAGANPQGLGWQLSREREKRVVSLVGSV